MIESALRLIPDGCRYRSAPKRRRIDRRFCEWLRSRRRVESLEENGPGMLAALCDHSSHAPGKQTVVAEVPPGAREVCFERIKKWKRFLRTHPIVIAAKRDGVLVQRQRDSVHNLVTRLPVEFRVASVYSHCEHIGEFEVRLRRNRGEIKRAPRKLHAQLVDEVRRKDRGQAARQRLVAKEIVPEGRRQIGPVIDEITNVQIVLVAETVVHSEKSIVRVAHGQDAAKVPFCRQLIRYSFHSVDVVDVGQDERVIEMRFGTALQFVVGVEKSLVFLNRSADGAAELVLTQSVPSFCLQDVDSVQLVVPEV